MRKAIYVYNPMSGGRGVRLKLDHILERFQSGGVLVQPYRLVGGNPDQLRGILQSGGFDFLVVSGGDGTLNSIVNLMLKNDITIPLGIIPSGTCNDLAGSLNLPSSVNECIEIILSGATTGIDVGLINEKDYFLSTCAGGVFVDVSFNTHTELKKNFGPFAYYLKALTEVASVKSFNLKITTESKTVKEEALLFVILNGKHGGGFQNLLHEADVSDGIMDIVIVKRCLSIDLAGIFFKVLNNRTLKDRNVTTLNAKSCRVECDIKIPVSVDGEKGPDLPHDIRFINKALKVFIRK